MDRQQQMTANAVAGTETREGEVKWIPNNQANPGETLLFSVYGPGQTEIGSNWHITTAVYTDGQAQRDAGEVDLTPYEGQRVQVTGDFSHHEHGENDRPWVYEGSISRTT